MAKNGSRIVPTMTPLEDALSRVKAVDYHPKLFDDLWWKDFSRYGWRSKAIYAIHLQRVREIGNSLIREEQERRRAASDLRQKQQEDLRAEIAKLIGLLIAGPLAVSDEVQIDWLKMALAIVNDDVDPNAFMKTATKYSDGSICDILDNAVAICDSEAEREFNEGNYGEMNRWGEDGRTLTDVMNRLNHTL